MTAGLRQWLKTITGGMADASAEKLPAGFPFLKKAAEFSYEPGTVALMSGGESDCARFHILAAAPWLKVLSRGTRIELFSGGRSIALDANPFDTLEVLLEFFELHRGCTGAEGGLPVKAGLFGYISYDLKNFIEKLPRTAVNDLALPDMCLYAPSVLVVHDRRDGCSWLCSPKWERPDSDYEERRKAALDRLSAPPADMDGFSFQSSGRLRASMSKQYYLEAVGAIKGFIRSGDIYQANFAQRFETDFYGSPFAFFKHLFETAPAPFYAYINAGDHQIVSTSPERFIKQSGREIETRPIKGTRPRGGSREEDEEMRRALLESEKDEAELSMIVDLLRNDLGRVSAAGSVKVAEHRRLEEYKNVFHLVSVITGRLISGRNSVDIIKAAFPGGSITGCPRIRAMEIIDELEPCARHVYTGSIGYISFHNSMDLSIAIRTATIAGGRLLFSVGGGIVYDSAAEEEYLETLDKGRSLAEALKKGNKGCSPAEANGYGYIWMSGGFVPEDQARIPFSDLGVQYGYAFFETIRVQDGVPAFLDEHIERFSRSWRHLFKTPVPLIDWETVIRQLICKNGLSSKTAAVKLMATRGSRDGPPYDHQLLAAAKPYIGREALARRGGLGLYSYPYPRHTPLADYKTANYLYYYLAGRQALRQGADEALILNPDGSVSETNTGSIIIIRENFLAVPFSPHVLPGVMQARVIEYFEKKGYKGHVHKLFPSDLFTADAVIVTNSLMGAAPALSLDGRCLKDCSQICSEICRHVL